MRQLTFVIPTRKRHRELSACVRSIAEQIEGDTRIHILFNSCETDTVRTVERLKSKWQCVDATGIEGPEPWYSDKFRAMFRLAPESEWVWTFGDDEELLPGALKYMLARLNSAADELSFIHVAEDIRSTRSGHCYSGRMVELCLEMGWLEFTGFISGNIVRTKKLAECAETPNWDIYAKSPFVQSCALFEHLRKDQAQFIDQPLFRLQKQDDDQLDVISKAWEKDSVGAQYLYLADAMQVMYDQGLIKSKLPAKFFRYHNYHLWDRFIAAFVSEYLSKGKMWFDEWAMYTKKLTTFLIDEELAAKVCQDVDGVRRLAMLHSALSENVRITHDEIVGVMDSHNQPQYALTYMPVMEAEVIPFQRKAA